MNVKDLPPLAAERLRELAALAGHVARRLERDAVPDPVRPSPARRYVPGLRPARDRLANLLVSLSPLKIEPVADLQAAFDALDFSDSFVPRDAFFAVAGRPRFVAAAGRMASAVKALPPAPKARGRKAARLDWLPRALILVKEHPGWTDYRIAQEAGVHRSRLSRDPTYQAAARLARDQGRRPARGFITRDADTGRTDLEAIDE